MKSKSSDGLVEGFVKMTPCGCRGFYSTPRRTETKLFRSRYVNNVREAKNWIDSKIRTYEECRYLIGEFKICEDTATH